MKKGFIEPGAKPKRFYKDVAVVAEDGGFAVKLDGRNVRSPKGGKLNVPTQALADMVAAEWAGQGEVIEMADMAITRLAFTATEAIPPAREATAEQVAEYAASDLLCYFAGEPESLHQRQVEAWEPILQRAERELALVFVRTTGIIHTAQPEETLAKIRFKHLPQPLPPIGELADVTVTLPALPARPTVPNASLQRVDGKLGVWRAEADTLQFMPVKVLGRDLEGHVQVDGLKAGERVVVYSQRALGAHSNISIVARIPGVSP